MTDLQLELTRLIGSKELTFGCWLFIQNPDGYARFIEESDVGGGFTIMSATDGYSVLNDSKEKLKEYTVIGHPATLSDLHRWFIEHEYYFDHYNDSIRIRCDWRDEIKNFTCGKTTEYNSSLDLLDQSESTLQAIINLIKEYEKDSMEAN